MNTVFVLFRRAFFICLLVGISAISVSAQGTVYVVARGDNLSRIAQRYGVNINALAAANGITNYNFIYVGQRLVIPQGTTNPAPQPSGNTYIVQHGDTLSRIASTFGRTQYAIAAANNLFNVNRIYAGQVLIIPAAGSYSRVTTYIVRPGDYLNTIARSFNSNVAAITAYNGLYNANLIYPGQILYIPY